MTSPAAAPPPATLGIAMGGGAVLRVLHIGVLMGGWSAGRDAIETIRTALAAFSAGDSG